MSISPEGNAIEHLEFELSLPVTKIHTLNLVNMFMIHFFKHQEIIRCRDYRFQLPRAQVCVVVFLQVFICIYFLTCFTLDILLLSSYKVSFGSGKCFVLFSHLWLKEKSFFFFKTSWWRIQSGQQFTKRLFEGEQMDSCRFLLSDYSSDAHIHTNPLTHRFPNTFSWGVFTMWHKPVFSV